jgi:hypothetical protein
VIDLTSRSGKYRIVQDAEGELVVYRHGERWLSGGFAGPKMLIELCCELEELRIKAAPKPGGEALPLEPARNPEFED